ncbi:MAG: UDP-3-O-(3-hydroxymyristoyl)glucosamine N-acyltransferase [Armatimonadota bacterium]|nr:UDP-3-O-(3-hydroxymyristoyl)glucosamine N-acyltransferase [Armatimonadota bacterium]
MRLTARELAEKLGGLIEGSDDVIITGVNSVDYASEGDVVLAENEKFFKKACASGASCIVTAPNIGRTTPGKTLIRVENPADAFITVLELFMPEEPMPARGVSKTAVVGSNVRLGRDVRVGANAFIGDRAVLGDGCVVHPNVHIGADVVIGDSCILYPGVVIYPRCRIGNRVVLHAGVVIGADGFGYRQGPNGLRKIPQVGIVEIGDDVEIGANSTVDRAKFGATIIGSGSKIDNLVHIAHNVKIGRNCIIVALSGVAGSVEIGDNVTLAAQTGVKDNVRIGDGCIVAARAGVIGDLQKGSVVSGFPARDHFAEKRAQAAWLRLPEMLKRLKVLESEVERLSAQMKGEANDDTDR